VASKGKWTDSWGAAETAASVHAALGDPDAFVRVALADGAGNLRVVASHGRGIPLGRRRSSRRREAFATGREVSVILSGAGDRRLALLPMLAQNEALGVVEVVGISTRVDERLGVILALVRQSAELVKLTRQRAKSERALREITNLSSLTADLMATTDPFEAMTAAADASWRHTRIPVVILHHGPSDVWRVGATRGVGSAKHADLHRAVGAIPVRGDSKAIAAIAQRVETVLHRAVDAFVEGPVVLFTSRSKEASPSYLQTVASLLAQVMRDGGDARSYRDGIGLALAAHELKGPLVGARAALDHVIESGPGGNDEALLRRTRIELENLTQLVGPLLEWGAGRVSLRRQECDLVEIVKDAVASCLLGRSEAHVRLDIPEQLPVHVDPAYLRTAIANLIRNALSYSPSDDPVTVTVRRQADTPTIVVRDHGPGIFPEELEAIFEPFARGRVGRSARSGNGLGLFIARRVIEAHGGSIEIEPSDRGASFAVRLPGAMITGSDLDGEGSSSSMLSA